jgi:hypothetical protein
VTTSHAREPNVPAHASGTYAAADAGLVTYHPARRERKDKTTRGGCDRPACPRRPQTPALDMPTRDVGRRSTEAGDISTRIARMEGQKQKILHRESSGHAALAGLAFDVPAGC